MIKGRKEKIDYLSFTLPKAINVVEKAGFEKPSEKNIRDLAKSMKHTNVNHKASFADMEGKVSCLKVARSDLPKDCIDEIDKGIKTNSIVLMLLGQRESVAMLT